MLQMKKIFWIILIVFFFNEGDKNFNRFNVALIAFKSVDKQLIKKWYVLINYLIGNNDKKNNINNNEIEE